MRIVSLNAWGGRLHEPLIRYLAAADPDVLCLQEVVHAPAAASEWLIYRDLGTDLPQRANLFREVRDALPSHHAIFIHKTLRITPVMDAGVAQHVWSLGEIAGLAR
jgi:hypothetical protein